MSNAELSQEEIAEVAGGLTRQLVILYPVISTLLTYFFFGLYVPIFASAIYLLKQGEFAARGMYMTCMALLFLIATCLVAVETIDLIDDATREFNAVKTQNYLPYIEYLRHNGGKAAVLSIFYYIPPTANIVAETMLIHRCYIIWGKLKRVGIPLLAISLSGSVLGWFGAVIVTLGITRRSMDDVDFGEGMLLLGAIVSTSLNVIVTTLTAGRIWWVDRKSRTFRGNLPDQKLQYVIRILIESGVIYPAMMIIHLVVVNTSGDDTKPPPIDFYPSVVCAAGIAPSLVIIRGQIAKTLDKLRSRLSDTGNPRISDIRFTARDTGYQAEALTWPPRNSLGELDREAEKGFPTVVPLLPNPYGTSTIVLDLDTESELTQKEVY
ncbi:hypothetical protein L218DRAFT_1003422 [Marasmius fiardii PR-910]|nr:hypothetical protein L218DRAFT_1003422 [Marasmius fiardii PR-910]